MSKNYDPYVWAVPGAETATVCTPRKFRESIGLVLEAYRSSDIALQLTNTCSQRGLATPHELSIGAEFLEIFDDTSTRMHVLPIAGAEYACLLLRGLLRLGPISVEVEALEELVVLLAKIHQFNFAPFPGWEPIEAEDDPMAESIVGRIGQSHEVSVRFYLTAWEGMIFQSWLSNRTGSLPMAWKDFSVCLHRKTTYFRECLMAVYKTEVSS